MHGDYLVWLAGSSVGFLVVVSCIYSMSGRLYRIPEKIFQIRAIYGSG